MPACAHRVVLLLCTLLAVGCGSSPRPRSPADVQLLLGGANPAKSSSAGVPDYRPTGKLVADNGLRPGVDGFGFANYGDDQDVQNLTPAAVEELFGPTVCASGTRATCELIPPARAWMHTENAAMAAGHCFGMAAAVAQFFGAELQPARYGGSTAPRLPLTHNAPLQRTLAQLSAMQELPSVRRDAVAGTPNQILDRLIAATRPGGTPYVLGLFRPAGGGHAVTPYAVEDRGDDRYAVLVYDNNFPGVTRAISFDRRANAWAFVAQDDPTDRAQRYSGSAAAANLALFPATRPKGLLPCPFCRTDDTAAKGSGPTATEIALEGDPENHSRLLITDARGRRTGWVRGRLVDEIPGAEVVRRLTGANWRQDGEPVYTIPAGVSFTVTMDGAALTAPVTERLEVIGPGDRVELAGVALRRGERVSARVAGDGSKVEMTIDPRHDESPILRVGIEGHPTSWDFTLKVHRLRGGSTLGLRLDREREELDIDTRKVVDTAEYDVELGTYDLGFGRYDVRLDRLGEDGTTTFQHDDLKIPRGTFARLGYGGFDAKHRRLRLVEERGGRTSTERIGG
ncbi:hypothetical protein [Patulibacter sp.]|uniref:hypothetical protein n=1 Tax=Patulibacter sp. TaxID=1912859 RepID=UPI00272234AC|nr:hypothetical protein [Patulibacter sp.]MDO9410463.1 hypothetical protein [Patulibacter sp.]